MSGESERKRQEFEREALVHLDMLYNVALRLTGSSADAEDLVQDTVTRAYRSWDKYEPGTNARAWLIAIMRNTFINRFRSERRRPTAVEFDSVEEFAVFETVQDVDPEGTFFRYIVDDEVKRAVQDLPEEFRIPIVLSDVEGLSYAEIAEALDLPIGTVKSRLFRARRRLQRRLFEYAMEMGYIR